MVSIRTSSGKTPNPDVLTASSPDPLYNPLFAQQQNVTALIVDLVSVSFGASVLRVSRTGPCHLPPPPPLASMDAARVSQLLSREDVSSNSESCLSEVRKPPPKRLSLKYIGHNSARCTPRTRRSSSCRLAWKPYSDRRSKQKSQYPKRSIEMDLLGSSQEYGRVWSSTVSTLKNSAVP